MASMISRLYHDELRLSERDYPEDSRVAILLDSFKEDADWLGVICRRCITKYMSMGASAKYSGKRTPA